MQKDSIQNVEKTNSYNFRTDQIGYETIETKSSKRHFVTGYISVPEVDLIDDLVTKSGMQDMLNQINERTITLDYEHEAWRDDSSILPVGKIIQAKIDDRGLWVKAELNPDSPKFKDLWNSIKGGFVTAFSIAFKPVQTMVKTIGETKIRVLNKLHLLNVALTGNPVNKSSIITEFGMKSVMLKAIEDQERKEVNNMKKELKSEESTVEVKSEVVEETEVVESSEIQVESKGMSEGEQKAYERGLAEGKKCGSKGMDSEESEEESEEKKKKVPEEKSEVDLKSILEEMESLKSKLNKIESKGVFKSTVSEKAPELKSDDGWEHATVLGMIR